MPPAVSTSPLPKLLTPLHVGGVELPNRLFVAPMAGVTDRPFRMLCKQLGAGLAVSEMTIQSLRAASAAAVRTASSEQVRRPINRDGVDQWRPYDAWLDPLKRALGAVLDEYPAVPAHSR